MSWNPEDPFADALLFGGSFPMPHGPQPLPFVVLPPSYVFNEHGQIVSRDVAMRPDAPVPSDGGDGVPPPDVPPLDAGPPPYQAPPPPPAPDDSFPGGDRTYPGMPGSEYVPERVPGDGTFGPGERAAPIPPWDPGEEPSFPPPRVGPEQSPVFRPELPGDVYFGRDFSFGRAAWVARPDAKRPEDVPMTIPGQSELDRLLRRLPSDFEKLIRRRNVTRRAESPLEELIRRRPVYTPRPQPRPEPVPIPRPQPRPLPRPGAAGVPPGMPPPQLPPVVIENPIPRPPRPEMPRAGRPEGLGAPLPPIPRAPAPIPRGASPRPGQRTAEFLLSAFFTRRRSRWNPQAALTQLLPRLVSPSPGANPFVPISPQPGPNPLPFPTPSPSPTPQTPFTPTPTPSPSSPTAPLTPFSLTQLQFAGLGQDPCQCETTRRPKRPSDTIAKVTPYPRRMSQNSLDNLRRGPRR